MLRLQLRIFLRAALSFLRISEKSPYHVSPPFFVCVVICVMLCFKPSGEDCPGAQPAADGTRPAAARLTGTRLRVTSKHGLCPCGSAHLWSLQPIKDGQKILLIRENFQPEIRFFLRLSALSPHLLYPFFRMTLPVSDQPARSSPVKNNRPFYPGK